MSTIHDIQALGYTIGMAHGSVEVEEQALAAANEAAQPAVVAEQANTMTVEAIRNIDSLGKLPETPEEKLELATRIGAAAIEMLTAAVSERVAFHERALELAKTMPDVWHIDQTVAVDDGSTTVVAIYVACKADGTGWDDDSQALLDALAHQPSYDERVFQAQNPDALAAAQQLAADGKTVERETGVDTFMVDGRKVDVAGIVSLADAITG